MLIRFDRCARCRMLFCALVLGVLSGSLGCSVAAGGPEREASQIGTAQIALTGQSGSGTSYRLAHAKFTLTGAITDTFVG
jgi:hypothetical protein